MAATRLFLEEGRRVAMVDRDADALAEAAADLDGVTPIVADVSVSEDVSRMMSEAVAGLGEVHALVAITRRQRSKLVSRIGPKSATPALLTKA